MTSFRMMLGAVAASALLVSSSVASATTGSAAALSLANSPAVQDAAAADAGESGGDGTVWINIGILAALTAVVLLTTGGDGDEDPASP